ncbi:hypothetical protein [Actinocatenispora rupis]|uniref:Membrane protein n=1 Tax=Actinocatenispora rupis TaxID=519421 RepID=A0A8J3J3H8_9ACTN|nr:hypothetical protein [Actinocatenispora rupis]GID10936.1 membrane protein [Actinocatenispora rupis]
MTGTLPAVRDETAVRRRRITAPGAVLAAGVVLVAASRIAGAWVNRTHDLLHIGGTYPIAGSWRSAWSWWLPVPVVVAVALLVLWPRVVARLRWGRLLAAATVVSAAWAVALSLADGPAGLTGPLAPFQQYPHDVPRVTDLGTYLSTFARHVVDPANGPVWTVHVGGHPPGALGLFVVLQRIGLGGLGPAAAVCIAGGALAVPSVLAVTRLFGGTATARRAALFVPLAPAALWVATSADALFAGIGAAGLCALAYAAARRGPSADLLAALGGLALGCCLFLSYGLALLVVPALAVVLVQRRIRPLLIGAAVVLALLALAYAAGFDWWHGLSLAAERTRTGTRDAHPPTVWQDRPTWYFAFADVAALAVALGPAVLLGLGRLADRRMAVLPAAVGVAVLAALVSDLSKGEVERIWLPFAVWLLPCAALLPARRARSMLAVQLGWAVLIAVTVRTWW